MAIFLLLEGLHSDVDLFYYKNKEEEKMNFMETQRGYDFMNYDIPRLTEAVEEMAKSAPRLTEAVEEVAKAALKLSSKLPAASEEKKEKPPEEGCVMKWHNLIKNSEDLPKTDGMYLVVKKMDVFGEPDYVVGTEFFFPDGKQWDSTTPVVKWMELPSIGEVTE